MFRLETERLIIRPFQPEDRPEFRTIAQDARVMRFINGGIPLTDEQIDEALERQRRNLEQLGFCFGMMLEKASGRVIGTAGTQPLGTTGELEIGWWLAHNRWGRGFATEAGLACRDFVLHTLGRERVLAIIDGPNDASKRVAARLGMRYLRRTTGAELGHRLPEIVVDLFEATKGGSGIGEEAR